MELRFHFIFSVLGGKKKTCWRKLIQFPSTNCWHTGAAVPPGCYPQEPSLQFLPALTLVHTLQVWKTWIASSCVCVCFGVCVCVCGGGKGRLSQLCSGRTGKTFSPLYALCLCSVSGKRVCSNLHRFCMLTHVVSLGTPCLVWSEQLCLTVSSHTSASSLLVLFSFFLFFFNWWGQRSFVGRR